MYPHKDAQRRPGHESIRLQGGRGGPRGAAETPGRQSSKVKEQSRAGAIGGCRRAAVCGLHENSYRAGPTLSVRREREGAAESFGACRARDGALRREAAAAAAAASRAHTLAARACIRSLFFGPSSPTQEVLCTASPGIIVASSAPPWQQISTGSLTCHTWH